MSEEYEDISTESRDFENLNDEELEEIYRNIDDASLEFVENHDDLASLNDKSSSGFNPSDNPILVTSISRDFNAPFYLLALIQHKHLGTGQRTNSNPKLRDEIRDLGHKINGKCVDQCGHIVARSLGGKMERRNLFPVGRTTNLNQYKDAEKIIKNFITKNKKNNGRAVLQVALVYGDPKYPSRPTKFYYSYALFADDMDEEQNKDCTLDLQLLSSSKSKRQIIKIEIANKNMVACKTKIYSNRTVKIAENVQYWSSVGISILAMAIPFMTPTTSVSNPKSTPVKTPTTSVSNPKSTPVKTPTTSVSNPKSTPVMTPTTSVSNPESISFSLSFPPTTSKTFAKCSASPFLNYFSNCRIEVQVPNIGTN